MSRLIYVITILILLSVLFLAFEAEAMETSLYYGVKEGYIYLPYYTSFKEALIYWEDAPLESGNIIHNANLSIYYRPTSYYKNYGCISQGTWKEVVMYAKGPLGPTDWNELNRTTNSKYSYYKADTKDEIDKNNYTLLLKAIDSQEKTCIEIANASLIINYTAKGHLLTIPNESHVEMPLQNSYTVGFNAKCYEGFCGKTKYELISENQLISSNAVSSNRLLEHGSSIDNEYVDLEMTANGEGIDHVYLKTTSYYNNTDIGITSQGEPMMVTITAGSGSMQNPGELVIKETQIAPQMPAAKGSDVTVRVVLECRNGFCGEVKGVLSSRLHIKYYSNQTCIMDENEVCEFEWILEEYSQLDDYEYGITVDFQPVMDSVTGITDQYTIFYTDQAEWTSVSIVIEYPKIKTFSVGDQFELAGPVTCSGDCDNVNVYAIYKDSKGWHDIGTDTPIYLADQYQLNPRQYSPISITKKWNLKAKSAGSYELGMKAIDSSGQVNTESIDPIVIMNPDKQVNETGNETITEDTAIDIEVIDPAPSQTLKRGDNFDIKIKALKNDAVCEDCIVRASSPIMKNDIVLEFLNGFYVGTGVINNNAEGVWKIGIYVDSKMKKEIEMIIDPFIFITASADKYVYEIFDIIKISGIAPKRSYVSAEIVCSDKYKKTIKSVQADSLSGTYSFEGVTISRAVPAGMCSVGISAIDPYSNRGEEKIDIMISASEMETYNLRIMSPSPFGEKIKKGEEVAVIVQVTRENNDVKDMHVNCSDINGNYMELTEQSDELGNTFYKTSYKIPIHYNRTEWVLACVAEKNGEYGTNSLILHLESSQLIITVLEPAPYEQLSSGETVKIKVRAQYSDGTPADEASLKMRINGGEEIVLERSVEPGTYIGTFDTENKEILSFDISASDDKGVAGNLDKLLFTVKKHDISDYLLYFIIGAVIIVIALAGTILAGKRGKTTIITKTEKIDMEDVEKKVEEKHMKDRKFAIKEKLRDLQLEFENIENDIDMLHSEYFKREIDEDTFVKLLQERKERKENIASTMNGLNKELKEIEKNENNINQRNQESDDNYDSGNEGPS